jgi:O-antigen/teichoic acid export membrane protein
MQNKPFLKRFLPASDFSKHILTLTAGSVVAQLITFCITSLLARIFLPADFGVLSIYTSLLAIPLVFATGKYDLPIVIAEKEKALQLVRLCFFILVASCGILLLLAVVVHLSGVPIYRESLSSSLLLLLPVSLFLVSGGFVLWMWFVRAKEFRVLTGVRIAEALFIGLFSLVLYRLGGTGLIAGTILGQAVAFLILVFIFFRKGNAVPADFSNAGGLGKVAAEYAEFPKINILQSFLEMFQLTAVILIGSRFFAPEITGFYALCMRILQAPMGLIVRPVSNVFFSEASSLFREGKSLLPLTLGTIRKTSLLMIPVVLVIVAGGPFLFSILFGANWSEAGVYARILVVWICLDLVRAPVSQLASVTGRQKQLLYCTIGGNVLLLLTLYLCGLYGLQPRNFFAVLAFTQSLYTIAVLVMVVRFARATGAAA